jgi:hypothetical protein
MNGCWATISTHPATSLGRIGRQRIDIGPLPNIGKQDTDLLDQLSYSILCHKVPCSAAMIRVGPVRFTTPPPPDGVLRDDREDSEQTLFLRLTASRSALLAEGGGGNEFWVVSAHAIVDGVPCLLEDGKRDAQFLREVLISSTELCG